MAVVGIGIDVVAITRFEQTVAKSPGFLERVFTPAERERGTSSLAARWAAKEALAKALGAPGGLHWHDAEIVREADGKPRLDMRGSVAARAAQLGIVTLHLSMSHDAGIASAVVVAEN